MKIIPSLILVALLFLIHVELSRSDSTPAYHAEDALVRQNPAGGTFRIKNGNELQLYDKWNNKWRSIWFDNPDPAGNSSTPGDGAATLHYGAPED